MNTGNEQAGIDWTELLRRDDRGQLDPEIPANWADQLPPGVPTGPEAERRSARIANFDRQVAQAVQDVPVPASFEASLLNRVSAQERADRRQRARRQWAIGTSAAAGLCLMLWMGLQFWPQPRPDSFSDVAQRSIVLFNQARSANPPWPNSNQAQVWENLPIEFDAQRVAGQANVDFFGTQVPAFWMVSPRQSRRALVLVVPEHRLPIDQGVNQFRASEQGLAVFLRTPGHRSPYLVVFEGASERDLDAFRREIRVALLSRR